MDCEDCNSGKCTCGHEFGVHSSDCGIFKDAPRYTPTTDTTTLDRQVAEALRLRNSFSQSAVWIYNKDNRRIPYSPSTDWMQCGKLIEEYKIDLNYIPDSPRTGKSDIWVADPWHKNPNGLEGEGVTPLIAVCRAIVAALTAKEE